MSDFGKNLKTLFNQCMDLPVHERLAWVEQSGFEQVVKDKVISMLKNQTIDYGLTAAMINEVTDDLGVTPLKAEDVLHDYQLIKQLGRGGQGEVWLAQRQGEGYDHKVAIKIIKPIHSRQELLRFQAERGILASLKHTNIAQFIDGGSLSDGRLFMVLEWIDGVTLTEHIKAHQPSLRDILKLCSSVADAVQFAHQNGVIHRDIKPSNVLVNKQGMVKLLDFGVAKQDQIDITETVKDQMLTKAYASPEQLKGEPVSTATDVYGLGLLLYEVVTGTPAQQQHSGSLAELVSEVTEKPPIKPSLANPVQGIKINQDLDNLILKTLKKSPIERYQTVAELNTDINNYLNSQPVMATSDTTSYRLKKLIQRNPVSSVFALLLLSVLVILMVMSWKHQQAMKVQVRAAQLAQQKAEQQSLLAEKTKDFLLSILKSASPLGSQGNSPTLDDVLATGEIQLTHGLNDQPQLKINLLHTLASIHVNLGNYPKGLHYYQQSIDLAKNHHLLDDQLTGMGQMAINQMWSGEPNAAEEVMTAAQQLANHHPFKPDVMAWHWARLATWQQESDQFDAARTTINQAFDLIEQKQVEDPLLMGRLYNERAASYRFDDNQKGLDAINQAINYAHLAHGKNHPIIQERLVSKAVKLMRLKRYKEAEATLQASLKMAQKLYQENNPKMGNLFAELGTFYHDQGLFSKALDAYSKTLSITEHSLGKQSVTFAITANNLAYLHEDMGHLDEAEQLFRESLMIRTEIMAHQPMRLASVQANLARVLVKLNRFDEAQELLDRVMLVYQHSTRSNLYNEVTLTAMALSQNCLAGKEAYESLRPQLDQEDVNSWRLMHSQAWLGQKLHACGYHELANTAINQAINQSKRIYQDGSEGQLMMAEQGNFEKK